MSDGKARETGADPLAPLTYTHRSCIIMAVEVVGDMTLMKRAVSAVEALETPQVLKKRQTCASTVRLTDAIPRTFADVPGLQPPGAFGKAAALSIFLSPQPLATSAFHVSNR